MGKEGSGEVKIEEDEEEGDEDGGTRGDEGKRKMEGEREIAVVKHEQQTPRLSSGVGVDEVVEPKRRDRRVDPYRSREWEREREREHISDSRRHRKRNSRSRSPRLRDQDTRR